MGLAVSNMHKLMLSARQSDISYQLMMISSSRMSLAYKTESIANRHADNIALIQQGINPNYQETEVASDASTAIGSSSFESQYKVKELYSKNQMISETNTVRNGYNGKTQVVSGLNFATTQPNGRGTVICPTPDDIATVNLADAPQDVRNAYNSWKTFADKYAFAIPLIEKYTPAELSSQWNGKGELFNAFYANINRGGKGRSDVVDGVDGERFIMCPKGKGARASIADAAAKANEWDSTDIAAMDYKYIPGKLTQKYEAFMSAYNAWIEKVEAGSDPITKEVFVKDIGVASNTTMSSTASTSKTGAGTMTEQQQEIALDLENADYQKDMNRINSQDKRYELQQKNLETQLKACETQLEVLDKRIEKNLSGFKIFGS